MREERTNQPSLSLSTAPHHFLFKLANGTSLVLRGISRILIPFDQLHQLFRAKIDLPDGSHRILCSWIFGRMNFLCWKKPHQEIPNVGMPYRKFPPQVLAQLLPLTPRSLDPAGPAAPIILSGAGQPREPTRVSLAVLVLEAAGHIPLASDNSANYAGSPGCTPSATQRFSAARPTNSRTNSRSSIRPQLDHIHFPTD